MHYILLMLFNSALEYVIRKAQENQVVFNLFEHSIDP
jgi:hypothetical protein